MAEEMPTGIRHRLISAFAVLLATVLLAAICNFTIEYVQLGGNTEYLMNRTFGSGSALFALGTAIVWVLVILLFALTGRLWLTAGLAGVTTVWITYANYQKLQLRLEPLYPSDLAMGKEVTFLAQMVGPKSVLLLVGFAVLVMSIAFLLGRVAGRHYRPIVPRTRPSSRKATLLMRAATVAACVLALSYVGQFNNPGNQVRAAYEAGGAEWKWWFQKFNYAANGFIGGVLYNLNASAMTQPAGYSGIEMQRIAEKYSTTAAEINRERTSGGLSDVNVVLVLSEAFADPRRIAGVKFAEDPIPFTRDLMSRTKSGSMLAQHLGGGTANMEFEVLTGQSLAHFQPQMNAPFQQLVPSFDDYPSIIQYFEQLGHRAIAIHPYMTSMYQREKVYPILGFDEFIFDETMRRTSRLDQSIFISDEAAFDEVLNEIDSNDEPLLVNLVTMQNHYPMADIYDDPIAVTGLADRDEEAQVSGYARGLQHSDSALRKLIAALDAHDERTILVFYGDHQPAIWSSETRSKNSERTLKETVFFVWANFGEAQHEPLPTTSPIHFMNHVFELADAPIPPYYALLAELEKELPAMEHGMLIDSKNRLVDFEDLSPRARELLHDHQLVQYDFSVGQRFSVDKMFYPASDQQAAASGAR